MAAMVKRAGKTPVKQPLWALNWATFGVGTKQPMLGDVLVFKRPSGGHVAIYVGEDKTHYPCLGGNQSDSVCITRIEKTRLHAARRPDYTTMPANVRKVALAAVGAISKNEA